MQPERVYDRDFALVRQTIRVLLTKGTTDPLPGTYARIYSACQAVVCDAQRGEGLYDNLKLELERCLGNILNDLVRDERTGVAWLEPFVQACEWFWKRVVSSTISIRVHPSTIAHCVTVPPDPHEVFVRMSG